MYHHMPSDRANASNTQWGAAQAETKWMGVCGLGACEDRSKGAGKPRGPGPSLRSESGGCYDARTLGSKLSALERRSHVFIPFQG